MGAAAIAAFMAHVAPGATLGFTGGRPPMAQHHFTQRQLDLRQVPTWASRHVAHCQHLALRTKRIGNFAQALADTALPRVTRRNRFAVIASWAGGLLPRAPSPNQLGLPLPALQSPPVCHARPPIV